MSAGRSLTLALAIGLAHGPTLAASATADEPRPQRWTPAAISSDQYESSPAFSPDGRTLVFMRADRGFAHYRLLWSDCVQGRWTTPRPPPFAAAPPVQEADPFISADGRRLYFVSSRHRPQAAPAEADLDIFLVERDDAGRWGEPRRLPEPVNSPASELLPREDAQGRLWFGSSRPGGLGLSDIYRATPQPGGGWRVENLGPPINGPAHEYEAEPSRDGRSLVVVADRGDRSHLYRYRLGDDGRWTEQGRVPARTEVFQVGPLLSPRGERLLFAQADPDQGGARSGELFLIDLLPGTREAWPPRCGD
jgi:Tol biopolymer transport system component